MTTLHSITDEAERPAMTREGMEAVLNDLRAYPALAGKTNAELLAMPVAELEPYIRRRAVVSAEVAAGMLWASDLMTYAYHAIPGVPSPDIAKPLDPLVERLATELPVKVDLPGLVVFARLAPIAFDLICIAVAGMSDDERERVGEALGEHAKCDDAARSLCYHEVELFMRDDESVGVTIGDVGVIRVLQTDIVLDRLADEQDDTP